MQVRGDDDDICYLILHQTVFSIMCMIMVRMYDDGDDDGDHDDDDVDDDDGGEVVAVVINSNTVL